MIARFKAWLHRTTAPAVAPVVAQQPAARAPMAIADNALAKAKAAKIAEDVREPGFYAPYKFAAQVLGDQEIALDSMPNLQNVGQWAAAGMFAEGQGFFGYPYLAELMQRAEYRHAVEIWAEHSVRKWIHITGNDETKIKAIEDELVRLDVRTEVEKWVTHDKAFGRGQLFLDFGDDNNPAELQSPIAITGTKISKSKPLKGVRAIEPVWVAPGAYNTSNPLASDFYRPREWIVFGKRVHHSRMLTMVSAPVSDVLKPAYAFGGVSLTQQMKPYVDNWLTIRQAVAESVVRYSLLNLQTDMSETLAGGECSNVFKRAELLATTRSNQSVVVSDKNSEGIQVLATPLSGLSEIQAQAQEQMASVARIPLSVYLQITPTGLNATNDGETRNFYADVHSDQEKNIRPGLAVIIEAVQLSLFGAVDQSIQFEFLPLWEMSDKDKSDIRKADADADAIYIDRGCVSPEEVRERLTLDENSQYRGIDLTDPPPPPIDETDPSEDDAKAAENG